MSWFDAPASRPAPAVPSAAFPPPRKASGSSWFDVPASPAPAASAPIAAEPAPAPSVPAASVEPDPEPAQASVPSGEEAAADPVSAEPEPRPDVLAEEGVAKQVETPVFPLTRVFDNRPSRTSEPAGAEPGRGALLEHPTVLPAAPAEPEPDILDEAVAAFAAASKSEATRRAYRANLRQFSRWCRTERVEALPARPRTVARYLTALAGAGRSVSTIDRHAAAIGYGHRLAGHDAPTSAEEVRAVLTGIRNSLGRPPVQKKALTDDLVAKLVRKIPRDLVGLRDRAMVLLCFAAALRRSELVALDVADIEEHRRGLTVTLRRSKTDQAGKGKRKGVPDGKLKVPDAVAAWLKAAGIVEGPVFRGCDRGRIAANALTGTHFARIIKARCEAAGLDPTLFSGHSCRRGFASSADEHGADLKATSEHLGHAKLETTTGYMEASDLFRKNPGKGFV